MKPACILIFTLFVLSSVAQPFEADTFGRVKDPAFLLFIKSRNYGLVEDFRVVNDKLQLKLAEVWKYGESIYIDLNGEEFKEKNEAITYYLTGEKPDLSENNNLINLDDSDAVIHVYVEEEGTNIKDVLKVKFDGYSKLTDELIMVRKSKLYGIYTNTGAEILPVIFSQIKYFSGPRCYVCQRPKDKHYYIYDKLGKRTTNRGFYKCDQFNHHLFRIQNKEHGNYGIWSHYTNDTLLSVIYEGINLPNEGIDFPIFKAPFCQVVLKENDSLNYGIIDLNGNIIIEPKYQWIQYAPKSDYFVLKRGNKYGVVTRKNEPLLPFEFDTLVTMDLTKFNAFSINSETRLSENLLIFKTAGTKTGVMSLDKNIIIEPIYDELTPTYNGVLAFQGDLTGLLSSDGEIIVSFQKMEVDYVSNGTISGSINRKRCIWDFYGNILYR